MKLIIMQFSSVVVASSTVMSLICSQEACGLKSSLWNHLL